MRSSVWIVLLVFLTTGAFAQANKDTLFYDKNWKKVESLDSANYYRFVQPKGDRFYAEDFYKSGKLQMTGNFLDSEMSVKDGVFVYYYLFEGVDREVVYKKGKYHGVSTYYHKNGQKASVERYKRDKLKQIDLFNEDGTPDLETEEATHGALFPGGMNAYFEFFKQNQVYPEEALVNGEEERIVVRAVIDVNGKFTKVELEDYESESLAEEALRLIALMPNWIPSKSHNRVINQRVLLPVRFTLE